MRKMVIQEARMTNTNTNTNTNLLHMRKMVIQEARMTMVRSVYHVYDDAMINVPSATEEDGERS